MEAMRTTERWRSPDGEVSIVRHETLVPLPGNPPRHELLYRGVSVMGRVRFKAATNYFWAEFAHPEGTVGETIEIEI